MFSGGNEFTMPVAPLYGGNANNGGFGGWGDGWWAIIIFAMIFGWGNGGWGGGFGGGNGAGLQGALTRDQLCADMNFQSLENAVRGIQSGLCDGFYAVNTSVLNGFHGVDNAICTLGYQNAQLINGVQMQVANEFRGTDDAICTLGYQVQQGQNALSTQIADCCCRTQSNLKDIQFQNAQDTCAIQNTIQNTTRDVIDNQNCNTRQILDFLVNDKISTLQAENQALRLSASQTAQNEYLLSQLKPCPQPAYITCNPFTGQYGGYGYNGYGYNNVCGCNSGCCGCNA